MKRTAIGIFGGTFDPIHFGHLRAALEIQQKLCLDDMRLIPCRFPPHRSTPIAEAEHRFNMVKLSVEATELAVDEQEMQRSGPSYSIDTLMSLRREFPEASLCMVVGADAFLSLPSWYQWEKLIQLANIVVMYRLGWSIPSEGIMADLLKKHALLQDENLNEFSSGKIVMQDITALDISASQIRNMIENGGSPRFLLPEKVWQYIQEKGLYRYDVSKFNNQLEVR